MSICTTQVRTIAWNNVPKMGKKKKVDKYLYRPKITGLKKKNRNNVQTILLLYTKNFQDGNIQQFLFDEPHVSSYQRPKDFNSVLY